jgi:hypothetical protein
VAKSELVVPVIDGCFAIGQSTLALADANSYYHFGRGVGRESVDSGQVADGIHQLPGRPGQQTTESVTMATFHLPTRRFILAGGFAVVIAAAPAAAIFAVPTSSGSTPSISACAGGETEDTNICVPDLVPNSPEFTSTSPVGGLPEISGVPCTGHNSGECIGLAEEQNAAGPIAVPHSEVSASP